ncbi:DNA polymerase Y family protein [Pseudoxanthomonas daejeonensis]|uniref:DNA repair nucleotidyltransferase n=1 Tax=Pseudoxanthomonas daejeonensis TaxID=266062 RepID=A0ABQ6Z519_9GAMM|nr:DNA polymerase Y family protein [Pseudoxanthomonas daejeonensis]KAF1692856.1 DNA repair nucleotidyltransferase [Pseudoxanthomonas daejeonensis]UNK57880.1 DNA polymerase Y family protein [Pseudoxanthomonas daejeonensis]
MLWACVLLPQLALDAVLRRRPDPRAPLALVDGPAQLRTLHAVNAAAAAAGLAPGMRLVAAHALLRDFAMVEYDEASVARVHRFLAAWAYRHSSLVSMQWPGCLLLEVRGSFSLLGPWPRIEARLRGELDALGFRHRIALAPTPRAARVLAGLRDGLAIPHAATLATQLDQVPVRRACLPDGLGTRLQRMGITDLRTLRALPRDALRRRFGLPLLEHLDRMYGQADDPLEYYQPPDHFDARVELGYEVESHTALLFPLRRLVGDLCTFLSIRDGGVQRFVLRLEHERMQGPGHAGMGAGSAHTDVEVGLLAAEREQAMLFELARSRLERVQIPAPVVAMRLLARQLPPFVPASRDLFDTRNQQQLPWPQLRERLRARLGDEAVYRLAPGGDPRPERAWRRVQGDESKIATAPSRPPRPGWLLPQPVPLRGATRILSGPERLESGWWDDADARRDYYVLETAQGQQAWAFAPPGEQGSGQGGWMLHGWFG